MSFIVEDGTGVANANAYITVNEFRAYCDDRGMSNDTVNDATVQRAIVRATQYLDQAYTFAGEKTDADNEREWPRDDVDDVEDNEIPKKLKYACSEYTFRTLGGTPLWNIPTIGTKGILVRERSKLGPIEDEFEYQPGSATTFVPYPPADRWLKGLLAASGALSTRNYR